MINTSTTSNSNTSTSSNNQPNIGFSYPMDNFVSYYDNHNTLGNTSTTPKLSFPKWTQKMSLSTTISCLYSYILRTYYETSVVEMKIISAKENALESNLSLKLTCDFNISELRKISQYFISIYEEISDAANTPNPIDIKIDAADAPTFLRKQVLLNKLNNLEKEGDQQSWYVFDIKAHDDLLKKLDNIMSISNYLVSNQESSVNIGIGLLKTLGNGYRRV